MTLMTLRISGILAVALLAAPALADQITAKGMKHSAAEITNAENGTVSFTSNGRQWTAKLDELGRIVLDGQEDFNAAEDHLAAKRYDKAVPSYDRAARANPSGWRNRLIRYRRLPALDAAQLIDRAVEEWLWAVDDCGGAKATVLALRPERVAAKGSPANRRALQALTAKLGAAQKDKAYATAIKALLLKLHQAEGNTDEATALANELAGAGVSVPANPDTPAATTPSGGNAGGGSLAGQLRGVAVLVETDPGKALASLDENLTRYTAADLPLALLLRGKALQALGGQGGDDARGQLLRAGVCYMQVWVHFDASNEAPEALYRAGTVNAAIGNGRAAWKAYQKVVEEYPDSEWSEQAQQAAAALQGDE